MKKILLTLSFAAFAAFAVSAQIHSSGGQVYLHDGDLSSYTNPDIYVSPRYNFRVNTWTVVCTVVDPSVDVQETVEFVQTYNASDVDAFTPDVSSTTETEKLIDVIEQIVIESLQHVTANSGITFSQ